MFKRSDARYYPNPAELDIMNLFSKGYTLINIAGKLGVLDCTARKRFENLRINLGVNTNAQMMFEFGKIGILNTFEQFAAKEHGELLILIKKYRNEFLPGIKDLGKAIVIDNEKPPEEQDK